MHQSPDPTSQLEAAIGYLDASLQQLDERKRWARMRRFYELFVRPLALVRNGFLVGCGALFWGWWVGMGVSWGFSMGVLCTMVPILVMVWRARGGEDWSGFLADIHCADEIILALGEGELLSWSVPHPEDAIERGEPLTSSQIRTWVEARRAQLTVELTQRKRAEEREKNNE